MKNKSPLKKSSFYSELCLWGECREVKTVKYKKQPECSRMAMEKASLRGHLRNHSRILYDPPPRILEIKAKINKWDLIKLKSLDRKSVV